MNQRRGRTKKHVRPSAPTVKRVQDAPIVIIHHEFIEDIGAVIPDFAQVMESWQEPMFVIIDLMQVSMDLGEHIRTTNTLARGRDAAIHHPKIREILFVSKDPVMKVVVRGLRTATYGFTNARLFTTLVEARAYCYEQIKRAQPPGVSEAEDG